MASWVGGSWAVVIAGFGLAIAGCGSSGAGAKAAASPIAAKSAPADPDAALREQLHAVAYQVDQAVDRLATATESLQPLPAGEGGETKKALLDLLATIDTTGRRLNDETSAPDLAEVRKDRASASAKRSKWAADIKESVAEIKAGQSTLDDMLASDPPQKEKTALQAASDAVEESLGFLNEALNVLN